MKACNLCKNTILMANSEWILNERGAIYHLNVIKDELRPQIITVGDPNRVPDVSKHFDQVYFTGDHREFKVHTGRIGNKELTVLSTGMGTDNIDIALTELDGVFNYKQNLHTELTFIRLGTTGSIQPEIEVDTLLASSNALGFDNLMDFYETEQHSKNERSLAEWKEVCYQQGLPLPNYFYPASEQLLESMDSEIATGICATMPGFYGPQGRSIRLKSSLNVDLLSNLLVNKNRITNFEMETAGIYGLAYNLRHKCLSINAVIANRSTKTFSKEPKTLIDRLIFKSLLSFFNTY